MTQSWPDPGQALLRRYVAELKLDRERPRAGKPYESVLRRFQAFVVDRSAQGSLDRKMIEAWLRECVNQSTLDMAVRRAQIVSGFLDWLVRGRYLAANPISEIRSVCRRQSTAAIVRALLSPDPDSSLECLRGLPRFGSHLGPIIQAHVERMKTLGLRYHESRFRRFDEFIQRRIGCRERILRDSGGRVRQAGAIARRPHGTREGRARHCQILAAQRSDGHADET